MIQEYSEWTIGMSTDRLPAFAALAKAFGTYLQVGPEQYLADFGLSISVCSLSSVGSPAQAGTVCPRFHLMFALTHFPIRTSTCSLQYIEYYLDS
jgi:hypothetical protein